MKCRTIFVINIFACLFTQSVSLHSAYGQAVVMSKEYQLAEMVDQFDGKRLIFMISLL